MAKTKTSTEVKQRWINANYKRIMVSFRLDSDRELLDYIEDKKKHGYSTTELFREALQEHKNRG